MKKQLVVLKKKAQQTALAVGVTAVTAAPAFADAGGAIQAAIDGAKANMTTVTVGVLTVAAVGFGIGLVTSFLRR